MLPYRFSSKPWLFPSLDIRCSKNSPAGIFEIVPMVLWTLWCQFHVVAEHFFRPGGKLNPCSCRPHVASKSSYLTSRWHSRQQSKPVFTKLFPQSPWISSYQPAQRKDKGNQLQEHTTDRIVMYTGKGRWKRYVVQQYEYMSGDDSLDPSEHNPQQLVNCYWKKVQEVTNAA